MIDLRSYSSLETAILVKWEVPNFSTAYITDYNMSISLNGEVYTNIGNLLNISDTTNNLTPTTSDITISLSGIPTNSISTILSQQIKGSTITIYRGFFNPNTNQLIDLDPGPGVSNVLMKFKGIVTNYSISDQIDVSSSTSSSTIALTCNSMVEVLMNKVNGRRTNSSDFTDKSMSKVQALSYSNFNFGAK
jgi:hypothetical protein